VKPQDLIDGLDPTDDYLFFGKILEALEERGMGYEAWKLKTCCQTGRVLTCGSHQTFVLVRCDLRICDCCCERHGKRIKHRYGQVIRDAVSQHYNHKYGLKFLTLTKHNPEKITDPERLHHSIKRFLKDVRRLLNAVYPKKKGCGALAVLEVTQNFTIHCHVIVYGPYVLQADLSERWADITGDSRIVDIRQIKGKPKQALNYLFKYVAKSASFEEADDYATYLAALRGVRRIHSFGVFYNFQIEEEDSEPLVCPKCAKPLYFDKDFYFEYGAMGISFLKSKLGICPVFA
jgi:hypothetical protein